MKVQSRVGRIGGATFLAVSLALACSVLGCRPERMQTRPTNPRMMAFSQAGVSLAIGEEWECSHMGSERSLYPPTLTSRLGVIRVLLLPPDRSDPELVANGLRTDFDANPLVAKHSFRKQQFVSDSGVAGLCISYQQRGNQDGGSATVANNHYLVQNKAGRCVAINFLASVNGTDTDAVRRMLRSTLSVQ